MTEDVEPMAKASPEQARAFARGLVPRAMFEAACLLIGVAYYLHTGQWMWIVLGAAIGAAPVLLYVLGQARRRANGAQSRIVE